MTRVRKHKRVLAYVNRLRAQLGEPALEALPTGDRKSATSCPIARALPGDACLDGEHIDIYNTTNHEIVAEIECPAYIGTWTDRFDAGKYPELIA